MAEDLPYLGIHGYDGGTSTDPRKFVSVRDEQGRSNWVQIGAETPNGWKIEDYDTEKGHAVISRGGFKYNLPMNKSVILDSTKSNPYNPSWNNTQSQYSDAVSFKDLEGLARFSKESETFNSMIEDATGMPLYQIKEAQGRMIGLKMLSDYDQAKAMDLTGSLSSQEEQMLGTYEQDPMQMIKTSDMDFNADGYDEKTGTVQYSDYDEPKLQGLIDRQDIPENVKQNAKGGLDLLKQLNKQRE